MLFKDFYSIFSSGGHLVKQSRMSVDIFVESVIWLSFLQSFNFGEDVVYIQCWWKTMASQTDVEQWW